MDCECIMWIRTGSLKTKHHPNCYHYISECQAGKENKGRTTEQRKISNEEENYHASKETQ